MSIRVTVWNEYRHEKSNPVVAKIYPNGLHAVVADAVKDNPNLQRMLGRMTLVSLLKQGGADEESIKQINRVLQQYKKVE